MTTPTQRPRRCVLTGTVIRPGDVVMRMTEWRVAGDPLAPLALHQRQEEAGRATPERLSGPRFSPAFRRYLDQHRTAAQAQRGRWWLEWWLIPGAEAELRATFPTLAVETVLIVRRDGRDWQDAARSVEHTIQWIDRWETRMAAHCRATFQLQRPRRASAVNN